MLVPIGVPPLPAPRWTIEPSGIVWNVEAGAPAHQDTIETSGERCSLILTYGLDASGTLVQRPEVVWPMLRTLPNDTHASLRTVFEPAHRPALLIDGAPVVETLRRVRIDGLVRIESEGGPVSVRRSWFVGHDGPFAIERITLRNEGDAPIRVGLGAAPARTTDPAKGLDGAYTIEARAVRGGEATLAPRRSREMAIVYTARATKGPEIRTPDPAAEERGRMKFVRETDARLTLHTPDPNVDGMFRMAKIRAAESLFRTKGGLVHSPGGGAYYAAIWANDQAEYANPLFGYLGDPRAREAAETSFDWFARYVNPEYRPIPSSVIAEGASAWGAAGDRGDMAMIAYGAGRYALARGDRTEAARLWPLIEWCLEYTERKRGPEGVILSDSDELENRFPAGDANLNTSSLAYDALLSAASLAETLGHPERATLYRERAKTLRAAIDRHFAATVEGFPTYRYYAGNEVLRAWIATPLTVGMFERAPGTIDALFSPRLWTDDGLASEAGNTTFWDRATLYGFRGAFAAGATERALPRFLDYSARRLTGDHVPYAVEAYPEGNQRHLSAESALYVRAVTEGLFGLRPTGLRTFELNPRLPEAWSTEGMTLRRLSIAGSIVDLQVQGETCEVTARGRRPMRFPLGKPFTVDLGRR